MLFVNVHLACVAWVFKLFSTKLQFLVRLFKAYIRPTFDYTSLMWSPVVVGLTTQLERYRGDSRNVCFNIHFFTMRTGGVKLV